MIHRYRFALEMRDGSVLRLEIDAHDRDDADRLRGAYINAFPGGEVFVSSFAAKD